MPSDRLTLAIDEIRDRIRMTLDDGVLASEEDTKRAFITPLIEALGWDIRLLSEVRNEYRYKPQDNPADYALFLNRTPCLFVEAKALGITLDDRKGGCPGRCCKWMGVAS